MKIGEDFDKIEFSVFGLDLLEPNVLLSNLLITISGITLGYFVYKKFPIKELFYKYWMYLLFIQGISFFLGAMGHVFYNYTGVWGKYVPLAVSMVFITVLEHAMISLMPENRRKLFWTLSKIKSLLAFIALTILMFTIDVENNLSTILFVPSLNTAIGYFFTLGFLGWKYARTQSKALYLLPLSVLTLIPAALLQAKKISFHPWFDRNDASHLLIVLTLFLYYYAVKGYYRDTTSVGDNH